MGRCDLDWNRPHNHHATQKRRKEVHKRTEQSQHAADLYKFYIIMVDPAEITKRGQRLISRRWLGSERNSCRNMRTVWVCVGMSWIIVLSVTLHLRVKLMTCNSCCCHGNTRVGWILTMLKTPETTVWTFLHCGTPFKKSKTCLQLFLSINKSVFVFL